MCIKSRRHICLQTLLIILLVALLLIFTATVIFGVGAFLLTSDAVILRDPTLPSPSPASSEAVSFDNNNRDTIALAQLNDALILIDPATNRTVEPPARQESASTETGAGNGDDEAVEEQELADWLATKIRWTNCSMVNDTIRTGMLLDLCDADVDPYSSDRAFVQCFRTTALYKGLAAILPATLMFLSLIAVCRLCLCPILTLAIVYLLLAIALVVGAILFNSGAIIHNLDTDDALPVLFHLILALVILYTILCLLHILLFAVVTCERRRRNGADSEKIMKQSTDDEDDIDDPKAPLYENGFSPKVKNDFEEKIKDLKYIDDDMSYIFRKS